MLVTPRQPEDSAVPAEVLHILFILDELIAGVSRIGIEEESSDNQMTLPEAVMQSEELPWQSAVTDPSGICETSMPLKELLRCLEGLRDLAKADLETFANEEQNFKWKLERAETSIGIHEAKMEALRCQIEAVATRKIDQLSRSCGRLDQLEKSIDHFEKFSRWQLHVVECQESEAGQLTNVLGLQQELRLQLQLKTISKELRALRRVNSDAEYLSRKRIVEQDKFVKGLVKRYDTSVGLAQVAYKEMDRELQQEIKSLQELETKAQKLQEEFNEILEERKKDDEKRRARLQKVKQKFRIVARLHAYFIGPKKESAAVEAGTPKTPKKKARSYASGGHP